MNARHLFTLIASAGIALTSLAESATGGLKGTWYLIDGAGEDTLTTSTADADTLALLQPSGSGNAHRGAVTYLGSVVSLTNVGDFIQFEGDYAGDVGNNVQYAIRIGFYNSNGSEVNGDFSTASDSWIGLFGASGIPNGSGARSNDFLPGNEYRQRFRCWRQPQTPNRNRGHG